MLSAINLLGNKHGRDIVNLGHKAAAFDFFRTFLMNENIFSLFP